MTDLYLVTGATRTGGAAHKEAPPLSQRGRFRVKQGPRGWFVYDSEHPVNQRGYFDLDVALSIAHVANQMGRETKKDEASEFVDEVLQLAMKSESP